VSDRLKKTAQKLLKMSAEDSMNLELMTLAAVDVYRQKFPSALPHELPSTSHVLRVLIRRAAQEIVEITKKERPDAGLAEQFAFYGGMWDENPPGGYLPPPAKPAQ
jgi:hypothetical protein